MTPTKPEAAGISPELDELWHRFKESPAQDAREQRSSTTPRWWSTWPAAWPPGSRRTSNKRTWSPNGIGLIDTLEKFDPDLEIKFETHAFPRIRGASIDELRSLTGPALGSFQGEGVEKASSELEARLKRAPSDVAASDPTLGLEGSETRAMLSSAINALSEREKIVINPLLCRGADAGRDRRRPSVTESRVLPDPHEGRRAAPRQPQGLRNGLRPSPPAVT
jgi:Sigma-70 region 2